jgi:hypothetical protein
VAAEVKPASWVSIWGWGLLSSGGIGLFWIHRNRSQMEPTVFLLRSSLPTSDQACTGPSGSQEPDRTCIDKALRIGNAMPAGSRSWTIDGEAPSESKVTVSIARITVSSERTLRIRCTERVVERSSIYIRSAHDTMSTVPDSLLYE